MLYHLAAMTVVLLHLSSTTPALAGGQANDIQVEPESIQIGVSYAGQEIRVKATTPAAADVVMRVRGPEEPLVLKKKGKAYGLLWMNVGEVRYEAIPTLYLLRSSRKLDELTTPETLCRLKLGFDAIRDQCAAPSADEARELFGELLKLKEKDQLFFGEAAGIEIHPAGTGRQEASGDFFLPAKTPVGDYTVEVFAFQHGRDERIGAATVRLRRGAALSTITTLAADHGLLYGCLAVAVAVLAGLFTGFVFGK